MIFPDYIVEIKFLIFNEKIKKPNNKEMYKYCVNVCESEISIIYH